jgi:hypothetical protein
MAQRPESDVDLGEARENTAAGTAASGKEHGELPSREFRRQKMP